MAGFAPGFAAGFYIVAGTPPSMTARQVAFLTERAVGDVTLRYVRVVTLCRFVAGLTSRTVADL